jgi:hypothetical protein
MTTALMAGELKRQEREREAALGSKFRGAPRSEANCGVNASTEFNAIRGVLRKRRASKKALR